MILLSLTASWFLASQPNSSTLPPTLQWDLKSGITQPVIPPEFLQEWKQSLLKLQSPILRPLADLHQSFETAKVYFLKQDFENSKNQLAALEIEIFSQPTWSLDLRLLVAKIEGLRANLAVAEKNDLQKQQATERLLFLVKDQSPEIQKRLLDLLPTESSKSSRKTRSRIYRDFAGTSWQAGWIDQEGKHAKIFSSDLIPDSEKAKALLLRSRPLTMRATQIQIRLINSEIIVLPADPIYWRKDENLENKQESKSIWKSPWLWVAVGALAGGAGYLTYSQLQSGGDRRTR